LSACETHRTVSVLLMMGIASLNPSYEFFCCHSGMCRLAQARNPYSPVVVMDSGFALTRAPE